MVHGADGLLAELAERVRATVEERLGFTDHRTDRPVTVTLSASVINVQVALGDVIDPERLAAGDTPRYVHDFPAGSGRYVVDADGYVATIVNGEVLLADGEWTGATPGRILRGGHAR